jgi:NAD(P)-dependent dehydrogenase (short-subunit alcohol dehydrogenase family)
VTSAERRVVVTGTSSGIGEACALRLARSGWRVFAGVRRSEDGERLREAGGGKIEPILIDVTDSESIASAAARVGDAPLHGLVNNAGIAVSMPLEFLPLDELRRQLEVNVVGQVAVTQAFLAPLRQARGRVVNIGSIAGRSSLPFLGAYAASKYALEAVTDALRIELKPFGIEVAIVEPGSIATPIWGKGSDTFERLRPGLPEAATLLYGDRMLAFRAAAQAAGRRGEPAENVAKVVEHALTADRPKTRYLVGRDARRRARVEHLPDRLRDRLYERLLLRS